VLFLASAGVWYTYLEGGPVSVSFSCQIERSPQTSFLLSFTASRGPFATIRLLELLPNGDFRLTDRFLDDDLMVREPLGKNHGYRLWPTNHVTVSDGCAKKLLALPKTVFSEKFNDVEGVDFKRRPVLYGVENRHCRRSAISCRSPVRFGADAWEGGLGLGFSTGLNSVVSPLTLPHKTFNLYRDAISLLQRIQCLLTATTIKIYCSEARHVS
jgi:hypothetical protein